MNRLVLNKATSSNDEPTPGYLYNEISQMAFCSKESMNLVGEYLLKKLQRTDINVKLKTLKILKHLCDNKRSDFRNFLKKKIEIIKDCQACNIVHDELKGETPSMLVRKEASDLVKLIYSYDAAEADGKSASNNSQEMMKNNRIQGFGNSHFERNNTANSGMHSNVHSSVHNSYGIPAGGSGGAGNTFDTNPANQMGNNFNDRNNYMSKMSGFGNPYFKQNPGQKTKSEMAMQYLNEVANKYIPSSFVNKINKVSASLSKNYANGSLNIQSIMNGNAFSRNVERNRVGRSTVTHHGGGGYPGNGGMYPTNSSNQSGISNSFGRLHHSGGFQNVRREDLGRKPQESQTAGVYERKVIEDVLINAGINKVPAEGLLNEFAQKCETLDTKLIVSILTSKLRLKYISEEDNWKNKLKVLCAIKHLLIHRKRKENEKAIETLEVLIQCLKDQTLEELYRCKEIKHLKKQVLEIFVLMGLRAKQPSEDVHRREPISSVEVPNLLDMDDEVTVNITSSSGNGRRNTTHGGGTTNTQGSYPITGDVYPSGFHNDNTSASSLDFLSHRENYPTERSNRDNLKVDPVDDLIIHFDHLSMGAPPNVDAPQRRSNNKSGTNNSELFSSLHVKYQHEGDTRHTYRNNDMNFSTGQSIQNGKKKNPVEMLSSARTPTTQGSSNQINLNETSENNLIFLENNNQGGNTKGAIGVEKNLPHFNEANDFFSFDNATDSHFAGATSVRSCEKGQVQGYTPPYGAGIMKSNSKSYDQPPQGNYPKMHLNDPNKSAGKFQSQLTTSGNFSNTDDQINNFFNSFAISSKRNEEGSKKPSVQIDAFELLADELKL
ncbi:Uncharacterized protein PCOAH_00045190 [Plasmodium coatneyi]|uniref:ENTH domain-containing protein n=1 Tax=Plasmodium coatneyi TaxID=208452 RepID=A0A1B1E3A6_9APIC|nr:Uncharacterized protein PCOAH_00045190 [Plasmodium coatneyi]ANQ09492.1 Uncharacterized protein PCOAH_00045190 [Plasmodium coatneyi]